MNPLYWPDEAPRAFVPALHMVESLTPVLGTQSLGSQSPTPVGIGVYVICPFGIAHPAPLYYVSPPLANEREDVGVLSGWYVCATPGRPFTLVCHNVHKVPTLNQKGWGMRVFVDGSSVIGNEGAHWVLPPPEEDCHLYGWVIRGDREKQIAETQPFVFSRAKVGGPPAVNAGTIVLSTFYGYKRHGAEERFSGAPVSEAETCDTETADLYGYNVRVDRQTKHSTHHTTNDYWLVEPDGEMDTLDIVIFMRENEWLLSRGIIQQEEETTNQTIANTKQEIRCRECEEYLKSQNDEDEDDDSSGSEIYERREWKADERKTYIREANSRCVELSNVRKEDENRAALHHSDPAIENSDNEADSKHVQVVLPHRDGISYEIEEIVEEDYEEAQKEYLVFLSYELPGACVVDLEMGEDGTLPSDYQVEKYTLPDAYTVDITMLDEEASSIEKSRGKNFYELEYPESWNQNTITLKHFEPAWTFNDMYCKKRVSFDNDCRTVLLQVPTA